MELTTQRGAVPVPLDRPRIVFFSLASTSLLVERYGIRFLNELYEFKASDGKAELELKSVDALAYFLWAGLQDEIRDTDEELTLDQVKEQLVPFSLHRVFLAVTNALMKSIAAPEDPGKAAAAVRAPKPAAKKKPAEKRVSTSKSHRGLRSVR